MSQLATLGKPVKPPACFWPAAALDPDGLGVAAKVASEWLVLCLLVGRCSISVRPSWRAALAKQPARARLRRLSVGRRHRLSAGPSDLQSAEAHRPVRDDPDASDPVASSFAVS